MEIEKINKQIQQEKEHHARRINRLKKEICKQNERHVRTMSYLQNQKSQATRKKQYEELEELIKKCLRKNQSL